MWVLLETLVFQFFGIVLAGKDFEQKDTFCIYLFGSISDISDTSCYIIPTSVSTRWHTNLLLLYMLHHTLEYSYIFNMCYRYLIFFFDKHFQIIRRWFIFLQWWLQWSSKLIQIDSFGVSSSSIQCYHVGQKLASSEVVVILKKSCIVWKTHVTIVENKDSTYSNSVWCGY